MSISTSFAPNLLHEGAVFLSGFLEPDFPLLPEYILAMISPYLLVERTTKNFFVSSIGELAPAYLSIGLWNWQYFLKLIIGMGEGTKWMRLLFH
jgi:hypothetical protein